MLRRLILGEGATPIFTRSDSKVRLFQLHISLLRNDGVQTGKSNEESSECLRHAGLPTKAGKPIAERKVRKRRGAFAAQGRLK